MVAATAAVDSQFGRFGVRGEQQWEAGCVAAITLDITPKATDLSVPTHTCRCSKVLSSHSMPDAYMLTLPRQTLVERPSFWLF